MDASVEKLQPELSKALQRAGTDERERSWLRVGFYAGAIAALNVNSEPVSLALRSVPDEETERASRLSSETSPTSISANYAPHRGENPLEYVRPRRPPLVLADGGVFRVHRT